jgi:hypothetical protein
MLKRRGQMVMLLLPLAAALAAPPPPPPPPPAWAPPQQCFTAAGAADRPPAECRPGVEQCQRQPWGANTPQYHLRDRTCSVGDPNEPVYDPQHRLYHLFYRECSNGCPSHLATRLSDANRRCRQRSGTATSQARRPPGCGGRGAA